MKNRRRPRPGTAQNKVEERARVLRHGRNTAGGVTRETRRRSALLCRCLHPAESAVRGASRWSCQKMPSLRLSPRVELSLSVGGDCRIPGWAPCRASKQSALQSRAVFPAAFLRASERHSNRPAARPQQPVRARATRLVVHLGRPRSHYRTPMQETSPLLARASSFWRAASRMSFERSLSIRLATTSN